MSSSTSAPPQPAAAGKDKITCHVLDTTQGRPARGIRVRLELTAAPGFDVAAGSSSHHGPTSPPRTFESQTDDDGRVKTWLPYSASNASGEVPVYTLDDVLDELSAATPPSPDGDDDPAAAAAPTTAPPVTSRWTLRFDTAAYFAGTEAGTFFPEVAVVFEVVSGQQYHVPLLLSPYGYTTYRGS